MSDSINCRNAPLDHGALRIALTHPTGVASLKCGNRFEKNGTQMNADERR